MVFPIRGVGIAHCRPPEPLQGRAPSASPLISRRQVCAANTDTTGGHSSRADSAPRNALSQQQQQQGEEREQRQVHLPPQEQVNPLNDDGHVGVAEGVDLTQQATTSHEVSER